MQESVLVEQAVEHAGVDLLLSSVLGLLVLHHLLDKFFDPLFDLRVGLSGEDPLEVLISLLLDFLRVLARLLVLREDVVGGVGEQLDLLQGIALDLFRSPGLRVLQMLDGQVQLLLAQMRPIQDGVLLLVEILKTGLLHRRIPFDELVYWDDDVVGDVGDDRIDKGRAYFLDLPLDPHVVVQEVSLASQDTEIDSEVIVLAVHDADQAFLHFLSDVQDSTQVHQPLVVFAELADASDEELGVELVKLLEDDGGVRVVPQEDRQENREQLVDDQAALGRLYQTQCQQEVLRQLLERQFEDPPHSQEHVSFFRESQELFDEVNRLPDFNGFEGLSSLLDFLKLADDRYSVSELDEVDLLILLRNIVEHRVLDERQVQQRRLPSARQQA